jgi:beta-lactamase regulating signal transducer with metallopeptidase domain
MDIELSTLLSGLAVWQEALLDAAIKGAVLLIVAGAIVLAVRKRASAAARQMVWMLALAALVLLPLASAALPAWQVLPDWAKLDLPPAPEVAPEPWPMDQAPGPEAWTPGLQGPQTDFHAQPGVWAEPMAEPAPTNAEPDLPPVAVGTTWEAQVIPVAMWVWLGGTLLCLSPLVLGRLSLWRLARRCRQIIGPSASADADPGAIDWPALCARAAKAVGLRRPVTMLQSNEEPMPMVWGLHRPKLLLPAEADSWSPERRWVVLLHELAHAKRHDCLSKFIAHVACALYWFNPLCWLAFRLMQREAEAACDDLVLRCEVDARAPQGVSENGGRVRPSDYAQHLLEIASGLKSGMLVAYNSIAMARKSKLEGRLLAILDTTRNRRALTRISVLVAAVLVAAIAVPLACMRAGPPQPGEPGADAREASPAAVDEPLKLPPEAKRLTEDTWRFLLPPDVKTDEDTSVVWHFKAPMEKMDRYYAYRDVLAGMPHRCVDLRFPFRDDFGQIPLRYGLASGPWTTVSTIGPEGSGPPGDREWTVSPATPKDSGVVFEIRRSFKDQQFRVKAIGTDGVERLPTMMVATYESHPYTLRLRFKDGRNGQIDPKIVQTTRVAFADLRVEQIDRVIVQERAYRWSEFEDIPLPSALPTQGPGDAGPGEVAESFLKTCLSGNFDEARKLTDPYDLLTSLERSSELANRHSFSGGEARIARLHLDRFAAFAISNDGTAPKGGIANLVICLALRHGGWRITEFTLCTADWARKQEARFLQEHPEARSKTVGPTDADEQAPAMANTQPADPLTAGETAMQFLLALQTEGVEKATQYVRLGSPAEGQMKEVQPHVRGLVLEALFEAERETLAFSHNSRNLPGKERRLLIWLNKVGEVWEVTRTRVENSVASALWVETFRSEHPKTKATALPVPQRNPFRLRAKDHPRFRASLVNAEALDLDTGQALKTTPGKQAPPEYDIVWHAETGGVYCDNPMSGVRIVPLPSARDFLSATDELISPPRSAHGGRMMPGMTRPMTNRVDRGLMSGPSTVVDRLRGFPVGPPISVTRFLAVWTSEDNVAIVEIQRGSSGAATVGWSLGGIEEYGGQRIVYPIAHLRPEVLDKAEKAALKTGLQVLNAAVVRFRVGHRDKLPLAAFVVGALTRCSDASAGSFADTRDAQHPYGPYLQAIPPLPVGARKGRRGISTQDGPDVGWLYDEETGEIRPNLVGLDGTHNPGAESGAKPGQGTGTQADESDEAVFVLPADGKTVLFAHGDKVRLQTNGQTLEARRFVIHVPDPSGKKEKAVYVASRSGRGVRVSRGETELSGQRIVFDNASGSVTAEGGIVPGILNALGRSGASRPQNQEAGAELVPADSPEADQPRRITGDVELLKTVALQNLANEESIRTWQGEAIVTREATRGAQTRDFSKTEVEFVLDNSRGALRYNKQTVDISLVVDGQKHRHPEAGFHSGMIKEDRFYRYSVLEFPPNATFHRLGIHPQLYGMRQMEWFGFDPRYYMTNRGITVHDRLMSLYNNADNPRSGNWIVTIDGALVTVKTWFGEGNRDLNLYVFDMLKGGNMVRCIVSNPGRVEISYSMEYEQKEGVWVLKSYESVHDWSTDDISGSIRDRIEWTRNVVNETVPDEQFSFESMGVKPGDVVIDMVKRERYTYRGEAGPARTTQPAGNDTDEEAFILPAEGRTVLTAHGDKVCLQADGQTLEARQFVVSLPERSATALIAPGRILLHRNGRTSEAQHFTARFPFPPATEERIVYTVTPSDDGVRVRRGQFELSAQKVIFETSTGPVGAEGEVATLEQDTPISGTPTKETSMKALTVPLLAVAMSAGVPAHAEGELTAPMTLQNIIEKVAAEERRLLNLHVVSEWSTLQQEPGTTTWTPTPCGASVEAWYSGLRDGKVRLEIRDEVIQWVAGAAPYAKGSWSVGFDGTEGWTAHHETGPADKPFATRRGEILAKRPGKARGPANLKTGIAFTVYGYDDGRGMPLSDVLRELKDANLPLNITTEQLCGTECIRITVGTRSVEETCWLDPSRNMALRGYDRTDIHTDGKRETSPSIRVVQLVNAGGPIWFPVEAYREETKKTITGGPHGMQMTVQQGARERHVFKATTVVANDPAFDEEVFAPSFPAGYIIRDVLVRKGNETIGATMTVEKDWRSPQTRQGPTKWFWERRGEKRVSLDVRSGGPSTVPESVRRIRTCGDALQVHVAPGGDRVWLTCEGKVLASFDRQARTGIIGEGDHPDWATSE